MRYSYIAAQIDQDYKRKEMFKKKARQKCVVDEKKQCVECKYQEICEEKT